MKKSYLPAIALLLSLVSISSAQELANFYTVTGFRLTPLRASQYALIVSPSYQNFTQQNSSTTSSPGSVSQSQSKFPESYAALNSSLLYGLSNQTTLSVSIYYQPKQTLGQQTSTYTSIPGFLQQQDYNIKEDDVEPAFVLAHRLQSNMEISFAGNYYAYNSPQTSSLGSTQFTSTSKRTGYSLSVNFVLLGN